MVVRDEARPGRWPGPRRTAADRRQGPRARVAGAGPPCARHADRLRRSRL